MAGSTHVHGRRGRCGHQREPAESVSDPITVFDPPPDTTPPTTPGQPSGTSTAAGRIDLSWSASTDQSPPITYRIYRDGGATSIGQTTGTTFADTGLVAGSIHTYTVDAVDAVTNVSQLSLASDPITVFTPPPFIFADDFSSGTLANWSGVTRLTIDTSQGSPTAPSARIQVSAQTAFARRAFASTAGRICVSERVNVQARGTGTFTLARFLTSSAAGIVRVYVNSAGALALRADVAGTTHATTVAVGSGWVLVELCGSVGANSTWDLYRNGVRIVNAWVANTGTTPVAQLQIGDNSAVTATMNLDDIVVDQAAG